RAAVNTYFFILRHFRGLMMLSRINISNGRNGLKRQSLKIVFPLIGNADQFLYCGFDLASSVPLAKSSASSIQYLASSIQHPASSIQYPPSSIKPYTSVTKGQEISSKP